MNDTKQSKEAHLMLTALGAPGNGNITSIRERFGSLLHEFENGRPMPTREQINYAQCRHWNPPDPEGSFLPGIEEPEPSEIEAAIKTLGGSERALIMIRKDLGLRYRDTGIRNAIYRLALLGLLVSGKRTF